jgi:16S rRNA (guanine966-N2)-methyltransferase
MRVITGSIKGQRLKTVRGQALRPTAGKVKEALFDILQREIPGSFFLDLYAGIGGIGIEALSRGAAHVTFVESNRAILNALRQNIKLSGFEPKAKVFGMTAARFLRKMHGSLCFDILFLDPPYHGSEFKKVLPLFTRNDMIKANSIVVIEHFHKTEMESSIGQLHKRRMYQYGDTCLTVYQADTPGRVRGYLPSEQGEHQGGLHPVLPVEGATRAP